MALEGIPESDHKVKFTHLGIPDIFWESAAPYLFCIAVAFNLWIWFKVYPDFFCHFKPSISKLFDGALAFSSIMAGFASTLIGILFSIRETKKIKWLEDSGRFPTLKRYLKEAAYCNILLSICCVGANCVVPNFLHCICWVGLVVGSLFAMSIFVVWRVIRFMSKLL